MNDLVKKMAEEGYVPGIPGSMETADHAVEMELCTSSTCENCGHEELEYMPFIDRSSQDFRAFCRCPKCGNAEEL